LRVRDRAGLGVWGLESGLEFEFRLSGSGCKLWCSVFDVWLLVFCVWCLVFGVWCLVFGVWCLVFGVWCLVIGA